MWLILSGQTAIYTASRQGNLEMIAKLINCFENIDLNIQVASHGGTPLHGKLIMIQENTLYYDSIFLNLIN